MSLSYSLHATVFFLVAFIIVLPLQLSFGLQRKTYAFLSLSSAGAALEIVAYAARLRLYYGKSQYAALYLLAITAAPIFLTLGTYTFDCFPRVVRVYGGRWTRTHSLILVLSEVVAMILQVAGSIVAGLQNLAHLQLGVRVIQVGLAAHMLTMATFMLLAAVIAFKTYKAPGHPAKEYESLRRSLLFKAFIASKSIAHLLFSVLPSLDARLTGG
jgi:hypothetical protein